MNWLHYFKVHKTTLVLLVITTCLQTGCSVRRVVGRSLQDLTNSLYQQRDLEIAREGSASFLMIIDGLINGSPDDETLLLMGVQSYSAYASAFALGTDDTRAHILTDHALDYGLRLWRIRFGWNDVRKFRIEQWERELKKCTREDVPCLYWTANAWSGWITSHPNSAVAIADLPAVLAVMNRIADLDIGYQDGAVHLFFGIYYAVQPRGLGRDLEKSKYHFDQAIKMAGPNALLPRVLYARYYARALFDENLFESTLTEVIQSSGKSPDPNLNLMNAVARGRASMYLEQMEDLF